MSKNVILEQMMVCNMLKKIHQCSIVYSLRIAYAPGQTANILRAAVAFIVFQAALASPISHRQP